MRAVSRKRAALAPQRHAAETELGRAADGRGTCARCGEYTEVHGHERLGRSQGGDPTKPDCLLCNECNTWAEDNPITAAMDGWKFSRKYPPQSCLGASLAWRTDGDVYTFSVGASVGGL